ncbi:unnamed protein product [Caretta caretta]
MSSATIMALHQLFTMPGLPDTTVSDKLTTFTLDEFKDFAKTNLIDIVTIGPHCPQANGRAKCMVQKTKDAITRIAEGDWLRRLARFLNCST